MRAAAPASATGTGTASASAASVTSVVNVAAPEADMPARPGRSAQRGATP
jgi:hypothetical protein